MRRIFVVALVSLLSCGCAATAPVATDMSGNTESLEDWQLTQTEKENKLYSLLMDLISKNQIRVEGEGIKSSGNYMFQPGMKIEKAIEIAGGKSHCFSKRHIMVHRIVDEKVTYRKLPLAGQVVVGDFIAPGCPYF